MEKTISLGDKDIHLMSTAATPLIYKREFRTDFFADMLKLASGFGDVKTKKDGSVDTSTVTEESLANIDISILYNFIWALAKNKDNDIPEPIKFFSQFETLDMENSMPQVQDLLVASIQTVKK